MKTRVVVGIALVAFTLCEIATAAGAPADCSVPAERVLQRFDFDLSGDERATRSVNIPADTEVLIEAFESGVDARLEVRVAGAELTTADGPVERWPPHRLIIAKGSARKADISAFRAERTAAGRVDIRMSRLEPRDEPRCVQFWRAMASGDTTYSRAMRTLGGEINAPDGSFERAYEAAAAAYARALRILGPGGLDEAQARLVYAAALVNGTEQFPEGAEAALLAERRFKALGHEYGRIQARYYWARAQHFIAHATPDEAEANRTFGMSRDTLLEVAADHLRRGESYEHAMSLGDAAYVSAKMHLYAESIAGFQGSLEAYGQSEPTRALSIRQNLGYLEGQLGRYQEALKRHLEILAEGEKDLEPVAYFANLNNAAYAELKLGKYDAALRHYSDAYARGQRAQFGPQQATALLGLGNTYHAIGNFGEALSYLERSLELWSAEEFPQERGATLRAIANVLSDTGRGREAIARREEALRIAHGPMEKARVTLELIDDRIKVGDLAIAKSLTAPLLAAGEMPDPTIRIGATLASARIALAEGDAASASRDARTAAEYYKTHEFVSSEFVALLIQARAACAAGARDEALDIAHSALRRAEEVRTLSSNPTLRASLWQPLRPAFGFTIGVLARANSCGSSVAADPTEALAIAEASRGRALDDFRRRSMAGSAVSRTNERRRELFENLAGVRQQLETLAKTVSADDKRLKVLRTEAARLRREIDLSGGLPASNKTRDDDLGSALRTRIDAIPKDTAVVEYWLGKDEAFAWLLTRGRVQLVDLGPPARIDNAARLMHEAMRNWLSGTVGQRIERARELHALIIAPLPSDLSHARTVYFIPDGSLHAVPFAALAQPGPAQPRFLVDSHDLAVAPAFLAIAPGKRLAVRRSSPALVVVDPVYARDDARFTRAVSTAPGPLESSKTLRGSESWTRLPATAREATTIGKLLDRDAIEVLSGFEASRDSLLGRDLSRYDILHFATHAVADMESPQLSALVLSTVDANGTPRVGEVFAGDLADQRMRASLVVFSGCETALGRAEAGEGLLSLRYAAHASGARAVVASLWPVMDATGQRLMDDLYAEVIGRNASPVAALSRAMRIGRKSWNDPALWASFDVSISGF